MISIQKSGIYGQSTLQIKAKSFGKLSILKQKDSTELKENFVVA